MNDERPGGSIRIGDSEREDAVKRLGEHYEAGRLSAEEHSERVDQALRARTGADLNALFADLPGPAADTASAGTRREGSAGPGWSGGRPPWAARGPLGRIPLPLLMLLGVFAVLASVGCVVGGGHPPVLPLLLIVGAVLFVRKRRTERRA
ncbi:DUF1707 domain-containing protein [Kribbella sp. NPDC003505]|uniref:DUF1707 SHOCT-like domain-containing protein n=1 Tax=Kribbella sp. NPDC003505 TaxID=3154448 RepID=UPI0033A3E345